MRRNAFLLLAVAVGLAWGPLLRPAGQATIIVGGIYSGALWQRDITALFTPEPRMRETREAFAGSAVRVSWWRPGWGDSHPAVMLVNGATRAGNDDRETRRLAEALARAGYLVMLPEFAFLKDGRLERDATRAVADAFALMRALPETAGRAAGAFGFSVGGGILLAAAGTFSSLGRADYLAALGAYFDMDTYLASVVSGEQPRGAGLEAWFEDPEVRERLPAAAVATIGDSSGRARLLAALDATGRPTTHDPPPDIDPSAAAMWRALAAINYGDVLSRLRALPPDVRASFDALSPRASWSHLTVPVLWLHDAGDRFEPISEAESAAAAARPGGTELYVSHLISHAAPLGEPKGDAGLGFWATELRTLLAFAMAVLRAAG
ncbi:MAG: alpha/beta hydrolase family protein [Candidatus Limnocylindria bacterium]